MGDLSFDVQLRWSGTGRDGAGEVQADGLAVELSGPKSMGGRGVGTSPEELLVCAVSSCYTATLFAMLRRVRLPVDSVAVAASGTVTGFPHQTRFASILVSPTILGGAPERQEEYEATAIFAHERCFIGHSLAPEVDYEVGSVTVSSEVALGPAVDIGRPRKSAARVESDERPVAWPAA
ncbi:MAG TPA: OsmC family protein [Solirubrobacteraceae bacterium]|nr:OsmC family protein [Solirubrobacteraceae bacterium]